MPCFRLAHIWYSAHWVVHYCYTFQPHNYRFCNQTLRHGWLNINTFLLINYEFNVQPLYRYNVMFHLICFLEIYVDLFILLIFLFYVVACVINVKLIYFQYKNTLLIPKYCNIIFYITNLLYCSPLTLSKLFYQSINCYYDLIYQLNM